MKMKSSVEKLPQWLSSQIKLAAYVSRRQAERQRHPFITISRQAGAGGITIAEKLAKHLHKKEGEWTVFDHGLVSYALKEHELPARMVQYLPEDRVSEIQGTLREVLGLHPSLWSMVSQVSETILHLAHLGNVILVGRGANVVTAHLPQGFHVRLIGSFERRTEHIQEYYHLGRKGAEQLLKKEDLGRRRYLKSNFHVNIDDPLLYHLTINTDRIPFTEAARMIGDLVEQRELAVSSGGAV